MRDHTQLRAFQLADELALVVYAITKDFPRFETYGLAAQMRRAAVSVPSNIVEGCARETEKEYVRFLDMAFSSLRQLHYQFSLAYRLGYIESKSAEAHVQRTDKVLCSLIRSRRARWKSQQ